MDFELGRLIAIIFWGSAMGLMGLHALKKERKELEKNKSKE